MTSDDWDPSEIKFLVSGLICLIFFLQFYRLLLLAHRYFINTEPTSLYSFAIKMSDMFTLTLACMYLPIVANSLTCALAFIALADMLISVIRDPVLQIWHRTLLQVSLFTTRKAVPSISPSFPKYLGWTLKLGRMIWWIVVALQHTKTQSARRKEMLLRGILVFVFPVLVLCEILTILSSAGFTRICLALLPVAEALVNIDPISIKLAILITVTSLGIGIGAVIIVGRVLPKLEGALINICRQRQLGNPNTQNTESDKELAILKNNKFDLDSLIFGLNCPKKENWGYKKEVQCYVSWVLDEKYRCTAVCEVLEDLEDQSAGYSCNEKELMALAQDLAENKIQLVSFNNDLGNDINVPIIDFDHGEDSIRRDVDDVV